MKKSQKPGNNGHRVNLDMMETGADSRLRSEILVWEMFCG